MKYRKLPVVIEAVRVGWDTWDEVCEFADVGPDRATQPHGCYIDADGNALPDGQSSDRMGLLIPTLEGVMLAREGDYIIRGVKRELYPCKPDIFAATYEAVE